MKIEEIMEKNMQKIEASSPEAQSADIVAGNIDQLRALFPELISEFAGGVAINVEVLKALVGDKTVTDADEKYGLNWHGKRRARQLALTPSTGTLRPCKDESVDWETTQNLMIEGDNLEVLKLLQKSYAGKVKLIYIDPPYNTGNDFVYPDNFQDNIKNYLELTGQVEGKVKISSNTEASGRFHTDWLNMLYPRLKLARNLLREDGVLFVSIDDNEVANLRKLCDEIFGEENLLQELVWKRHAGGGNDAKYFATDHEYILAYAKSKVNIDCLRMPLSEQDKKDYIFKDKHLANLGPFKTKSFSRMRPDDPRPTLTYAIKAPDGSILTDTWKWEQARFLEALANGKVQIRKDRNGKWQVEYKIYLYSSDEEGDQEKEEKTKVPRSLLLDVERNSEGKRQLRELFGVDNVFSNPKPIGLIRHLLSFGASHDSLILDFFAGSGTTAHSVLAENASDGGARKYILVQLPEPLDSANKDQKIAAEFCEKIGKPHTISELTKERLRRAGKKIRDENPTFAGDAGFRAFKLDTSNIRAWNPDRENLEKTLLDHMEHIHPGRSEADIVYELLLKLGIDLCVPFEARQVAGKTVGVVGGGVLLICLDESINREEVETLAQGIIAWHKELVPAGDTTCIFRDNAFADDVAKTNIVAILEQYGLMNVRSL
ncbi:MAG: site-specific DNA-methyltransferase [Burkholderiaceae bacterium]